MFLVVRGLVTAPYYLLDKPRWLTWVGWVLVIFMLTVAWQAGSLSRRLWLIREMRREGLMSD